MMGEVVLLVAEHMDSGQRQLYVLPPQPQEEAIAQVTRVLERDQEKEDGRLDLMVTLVKESLLAGILAETGVFDRGYMVPAFIAHGRQVPRRHGRGPCLPGSQPAGQHQWPGGSTACLCSPAFSPSPSCLTFLRPGLHRCAVRTGRRLAGLFAPLED